jgi:hypothetical protein
VQQPSDIARSLLSFDLTVLTRVSVTSITGGQVINSDIRPMKADRTLWWCQHCRDNIRVPGNGSFTVQPAHARYRPSQFRMESVGDLVVACSNLCSVCSSCNCHCLKSYDHDGKGRRMSLSTENNSESSTQCFSDRPTAFENESQPLLGQDDIRQGTDRDESPGCCTCLIRRRWRKRGLVHYRLLLVIMFAYTYRFIPAISSFLERSKTSLQRC